MDIVDEQRSTKMDTDGAWKEFLDEFLPEFMLQFFPRIYEEIDWTKGFESLEQELRQIIPEVENEKRIVDKLIKVHKKSGDGVLVYIHIEIQSQKDRNLPWRMFIYDCRLVVRYECPILSLAVLGDEHPKWRPQSYENIIWGSGMRFQFHTLKLLDYRDRVEELMQSRNPFASFVIAHLRTMETRKNLRKRLEYKKELAIHLMELGLPEKKVFSVLRFIDYLMWLPKDMVIEYRHATQEYKEKKKMPFITPCEEIVKEEGINEGIQIGEYKASQEILLEMLIVRFGKIPASLKKAIQRIEDTARLKALCKNLIRVDSLKDFTQLMKE